MSAIFSGKIGVDSAVPLTSKWPQVSADTFYAGTIVERESNLLETFDGTGNIFGIVSKVVATDTSAEVQIVSKGTILAVDFGLDTLTHDAADGAVFTDGSANIGKTNALKGAGLLITKCAGTPAAVGKVFPITASHTSSGAITATGTPAVFTSGDTARIVNIGGAKLNMVGIAKVPLIAHGTTGTYFAADGTWESSLGYYVIIDAVGDKLIVALVNTEF